MKTKGMFLILLLAVFMAGCAEKKGDSSVTNAATPDNYFNEKAKLQGTIYDATTGNPITDASHKVTLVRGTTYQSATTRMGTQTFGGDYALEDVPVSLSNQTTYRLDVTVDGYRDFRAVIALDAKTSGAGVGDTLDKNYNYVGDIYLFPLDTPANDVKVNVTYNGEPVAGATVLLKI